MSPSPSKGFKKAVEEVVHEIPPGKLLTYGQVAALVGAPRAAQQVGWTAHWGDPEVPWQRVVNRHGRVAPGWPGGMAAHAEVLAKEGIEVDDDWCADLKKYQWQPSETAIKKLRLSPESISFFEEKLPFLDR